MTLTTESEKCATCGAGPMACECMDNAREDTKEVGILTGQWLPVQLIGCEALLHVRTVEYHENGAIKRIDFYP